MLQYLTTIIIQSQAYKDHNWKLRTQSGIVTPLETMLDFGLIHWQ